MLPIAQRILEQDPQQREIAKSIDLARYNNSMIKRRAEKSVPELIEELNESRMKSLEMLAHLSDSELDLPGYHPFVGDLTLYGLFVVIYRHERDHAEDIRQALAASKETN